MSFDPAVATEQSHPSTERPQLIFHGPVRRTGKRVEFRIDLEARTIAEGQSEPLPLTEGEFLILRDLCSRPGEVVSRAQLDVALGGVPPLQGRRVDIHISRLRRKFERGRLGLVIRARVGEGYFIDPL